MSIKTLREKFAAITEEQGKELTAAINGKDIAALETFCQKHGIELAADERDGAAEFFKTGKLPLADEELENVAGGCGSSKQTVCPQCGSSDLQTTVIPQRPTGVIVHRICNACGRRF